MICYKSFKILGFITRLFKNFKLSRSPKSLYCALVTPTLKYESVVRNSYMATGSNQFECVQRKFMSFVGFSLCISHEPHNYSPVAKALGLYTLADCRHMLSFKFFNDLNKIDSSILLSLVNFKNPSCSTCSNIIFHISRVATNYQQYKPLKHLVPIMHLPS